MYEIIISKKITNVNKIIFYKYKLNLVKELEVYIKPNKEIVVQYDKLKKRLKTNIINIIYLVHL